MEFRQIEAYVNVVKQKSFSKAAYISNVKQPTLSAHVTALEKELGVKLLDRTRKQTIPTPEGQLFYEYAVNLLNLRASAMFSVKEFMSNIDGRIRINASNIPAEYLLPEMIRLFNEKYPRVKFHVEEFDSDQVIENLISNRADIGFTGARLSGGITYVPILDDELVVISPKGRFFDTQERHKVSITEISNLPMVFREIGSGTRKLIEKLLVKEGIEIEKINIVATVNNNTMVKKMVEIGVGISFISKYAIEEIDYTRFDVLYLDTLNAKRKFYMAYNKKITSSPTANVFRTFVTDYYDNSNNIKK